MPPRASRSESNPFKSAERSASAARRKSTSSAKGTGSPAVKTAARRKSVKGESEAPASTSSSLRVESSRNRERRPSVARKSVDGTSSRRASVKGSRPRVATTVPKSTPRTKPSLLDNNTFVIALALASVSGVMGIWFYPVIKQLIQLK